MSYKSPVKYAIVAGYVFVVFFLLASGYYYDLANLNDHNGPTIQAGISTAYSNSIRIETLRIQLVTTSEKHAITISPTILRLQNQTAFIAYVLPYDIEKINQETNRWITYPFAKLHTTVVYTNITAINSDEYKWETPWFQALLKDKVDSSTSGVHTIMFPFEPNPVNTDVVTFINSLSKKFDWNFGWGKIKNPVQVEAYVDGHANRLQIYPIPKLQLFNKYNSTENSHQLMWSINQTQSIYIEYDIPDEVSRYQSNKDIHLILLATGVALIPSTVISHIQTRSRSKADVNVIGTSVLSCFVSSFTSTLIFDSLMTLCNCLIFSIIDFNNENSHYH